MLCPFAVIAAETQETSNEPVVYQDQVPPNTTNSSANTNSDESQCGNCGMGVINSTFKSDNYYDDSTYGD